MFRQGNLLNYRTLGFSKLPMVLPRRGWDSRFLNASRSEDLRVKIIVSYWNETNMTLVNVCLFVCLFLFVCLLGVITINMLLHPMFIMLDASTPPNGGKK